ncbi:MAG: hypothetical protein LBQ50_11115 [Planctomycetaceae bacterium]|jgi:hypothetical protein|nr:hypothetical protein [Planctomycetaceae bacterium]
MNNNLLNGHPFGVHPDKGSITVSFVAAPSEQFCQELIRWGKECGTNYQLHKIHENQISSFLGDFEGQATAAVIMQTQSKWSAFVENDRIGGIPISLLYSMAKRLQIQCVGVTIDDLSVAKLQNRPFGMVFQYCEGIVDNTTVRARMIYLCKDNSKWTFFATGEPLPFENTNCYLTQRKSDRLTKELLISYMHHLGINFDTQNNFYIPHEVIGLTWDYSNSDTTKMDQIAQQIAKITGFKLTIYKPSSPKS